MPLQTTTNTDFTERLSAAVAKYARDDSGPGVPQVAVRAERLGIDARVGDPAGRFHVASVGKLFTATVAMQLAERGDLDLDAPLTTLLPADELAGLFTSDGTDHAAEAAPRQLLAHTSGVADYFEDRVADGPRLNRLLVDEPDRSWAPADLLAVTRERQHPVARPGATFHYSDTGYVLLGRILEERTGTAFHDLLHERVFTPLGMDDTFLPYRSRAANDGPGPVDVDPGILPVRLGRTDIAGFRSLTIDWAGGGVASTPDDLVAFSEALHGGRLVTPATLATMTTMQHRFRPGIHYGTGMMQLRFGEFSPFLRRYPRPVGHTGILATHVFHDPVQDAHLVVNFGATTAMRRSVLAVIAIERMLRAAGR
ncbi:serine hydrolase domain-containing protein [Agromyces mangrovi Wang et al. 2018]|uniref:serine hydrolase domain-containing protein n=1 Tax=Agromyces mangrovi TaxID=1858653 RepID=UPI0025738778|nr:serine hydrolase domain-containing protein [Agromyces mangrovi]BDZ65157.1 serine hydrolase [Agromyces mangrovi]